MADQGKWFKLWVSAANDPVLDNLEIADFGRWAKFGAFLKEQGNNGQITIKSPQKTLCAKLQIDDFSELIGVLKKLPNCVVTDVTNESVTYNIKWNNWHKYQGDLSTPRVLKMREKQKKITVSDVTHQEEKRREEKRGDKKRREKEESKSIGTSQNSDKESISTTDEKKKFLEFVYLTEKQHFSLIEKYGGNGTEERIHRLNIYIGKKGEAKFYKQYSSCYHCILDWYKNLEGEDKHGKDRPQQTGRTVEGEAEENRGGRPQESDKYEGIGSVIDIGE